jgi:hypothetical protein
MIDIEQFNRPGSKDFIYILNTRAGGLGVNLQVRRRRRGLGGWGAGGQTPGGWGLGPGAWAGLPDALWTGAEAPCAAPGARLPCPPLPAPARPARP